MKFIYHEENYVKICVNLSSNYVVKSITFLLLLFVNFFLGTDSTEKSINPLNYENLTTFQVRWLCKILW